MSNYVPRLKKVYKDTIAPELLRARMHFCNASARCQKW